MQHTKWLNNTEEYLYFRRDHLGSINDSKAPTEPRGDLSSQPTVDVVKEFGSGITFGLTDQARNVFSVLGLSQVSTGSIAFNQGQFIGSVRMELTTSGLYISGIRGVNNAVAAAQGKIQVPETGDVDELLEILDEEVVADDLESE